MFVKTFVIMSLLQGFRYLLLSIAAIGLVKLAPSEWRLRHRLQAKDPDKDKVRAELAHSFRTVLIYGVIIGLFVNPYLRPYTKIYNSVGEYGWTWAILSFAILVLVHDAYFYFMHRWMHENQSLRRFHHAHHSSTNPTPFASQSFHWVEAILEIIWVIPVLYVLPLAQNTLIVFSFFTLLYNIYGHLGFEILSMSMRNHVLFRWLNTSTHHNLHHKNYLNGNYGLYFLFWERLFQTEKLENEKLIN